MFKKLNKGTKRSKGKIPLVSFFYYKTQEVKIMELLKSTDDIIKNYYVKVLKYILYAQDFN